MVRKQSLWREGRRGKREEEKEKEEEEEKEKGEGKEKEEEEKTLYFSGTVT